MSNIDVYHSTFIDYIKPKIQNIESIQIVPPEEITDDSPYPSRNRHRNQDYLILEPAKGYQSIDLNQLYNTFPDTFRYAIKCRPYQHPHPDKSFIIDLGSNTSPRSLFNASVKIDLNTNTQSDDTKISKEELKTYTKDVEYIYSVKNPESDCTINYIGEGTYNNSHIIEISKQLINEFYMDEIITTYGFQVFESVQVIGYGQSKEYWKLRVFPREKDKFKTERETFIPYLPDDLYLCNQCYNKTLSIDSKGNIFHCSCGNMPQLNEKDIDYPLNIPLKKFSCQWFKNHDTFTNKQYGTVKPHSTTTDELSHLDSITINETQMDIYLLEEPSPRGKLTVLYAQTTEYEFWIPYTIDLHTISRTKNNDHTYTNEVCYCCKEYTSNELQLITNVIIPVNTNGKKFGQLGNIYLCNSCYTDSEQQYEQILNHPSIASKLTIKMI